jgi:hypothetical protein
MVARYLWNFLIALDQFANTILGGSPDETISSRLGKRVDTSRFACVICKVLDLFQKDHCKKSIELDEGSQYVRK